MRSPLGFWKNFKGGFTLAEFLITLGIIGIVAAITIPNLITKHQKKVTATRLKANYTIFAQAIEKSQQDNGEISMWPARSSITKQEFEQQYILPYLNNPQETKKHIVYALSKTPNKNSHIAIHWIANSSGHFYQLPNGAVFTTGLYSLNDERYIAVDINGTKGPNIMGKDVFLFNIGIRSYQPYKRNKLSPGINDGQTFEEVTADSCKYGSWGNCSFCDNGTGYNGANCAALIAIENWEITENYPW